MAARYIGILVGVWYITAPFAWGYTEAFNWWHSMVIGGAVLALSASYLISWSRVPAWLLVGVGAYSMFSPFLYDYLPLTRPFFQDLFFGIVVIGIAAALGAATEEVKRAESFGLASPALPRRG